MSLEDFPHRNPLDICKHLHKYIDGKVLLDIGCGKGDLLEHIRVNKLCKEVIGIEFDPNRWVSERPYIIQDSVFNITELPKCDVIFLWLGGAFDYQSLLHKIKQSKNISNDVIIINATSVTDILINFMQYDLILNEIIEYDYCENVSLQYYNI